MFDYERNRQLGALIDGALLASVFVCPSDPGLTGSELEALAEAHGFGRGEFYDQLQRREINALGRYVPEHHVAQLTLIDFNEIWDQDPRDFASFEAVYSVMEEVRRELGSARATIARGVLIERAAARGCDRHACEVAVTSYTLATLLEDRGGSLLLRKTWAKPSQQQRRHNQRTFISAPVMAQVRDLCARRTDGRPTSADPLRAFGDVLPGLGYGHHRIWWEHTVAELRQLDANATPTAVLVLAAALAEGALTFLVRHAQVVTNRKAFALDTFEEGKPPQRWLFHLLVRGARQGGDECLLEQPLADACNRLNEDRQRIHAGRFIEEGATPTSMDIKPHHAAAAVDTTKRLLSRLLEWLAAHPAATK